MPKRIIVIDDEPSVRKSFELALEDSGYLVDTADSGEAGIKKLTSNTYDLAFLDLKMPGINGVETLREIRKIDEAIPVYIVTAFYGEFFEELDAVAEDGINFDVLHKPVDSETILLLCQSVLEGPVLIQEEA